MLGDRWVQKPVRQLKRPGDAEKQGVIPDRADQLQTHRQASGRSAARNGNGRKPSKIRRAVVAQE